MSQGKLGEVILRGTRAAQPAATTVSDGTLYYVTDESVTERSNHTIWQSFSGAGSGGITTLTGDVTAGPGSGSQAATIATNAVSNSKFRQSGAVSVVGRSANSTGNVADISATPASDAVLRESGSTLGFGTIATGGIANDAVTTAKILNANVTKAKIEDVAADKLLGRGNGGGAGAPQEITLGTNLSITGTTLNASGGGGGGGGLVLLDSQTASSSATLDFVSVMDSTYDEYVFEVIDIAAGTNGVTLQMRLSTDNGSTFSSTDYQYALMFNSNTLASYNGLVSSPGNPATVVSEWFLCGSLATVGASAACGTMKLYNANATTKTKQAYGQFTCLHTDTNRYQFSGASYWLGTSAVNAARFFLTSGNIASGTINLYGVEK